MRLALLLSALVAFASGARGEQSASPRLDPVGHVAAPGGYSGDVYGHRGHAYLSSYKGARTCPAQGVRIYSLANPRKPLRVSAFARVAGTWTEKTIVQHVSTPRFTGELAVTSFQACKRGEFQGFGLYDVTNPARPRKLALVQTEPRGSHEIWLQGAGRRAYVYTAIEFSEVLSSPDGETAGAAGFRIYDVSEPTKPERVGAWGAWKELGIRPGRNLRDFVNTNFVHSVITNRAATRAYVSYWDLGTVILDISDPARPRYSGRTKAVPGNAHSTSLDARERVLIETHETDAGRPRIYDVSRPSAPRHLADFALPADVRRAVPGGARLQRVAGIDLTDSVHDAKIVGTRGLFSWYSQGVVVADLANPARPRFLTRFRPLPAVDRYGLLCPGRRCTAVWGVDYERGYVLASDMLSGLWVLRIS